MKYYSGIDQELRRRRGLVTATLLFAGVVCVGVVILSFLFVRESRDTVYVVDKGSTIMATIASGSVQRDLEVEDHIRRFHELMFNLAPSSESQSRNLEQALHMADRSAYDWWQDQSESGYYARLVSADITRRPDGGTSHYSPMRKKTDPAAQQPAENMQYVHTGFTGMTPPSDYTGRCSSPASPTSRRMTS